MCSTSSTSVCDQPIRSSIHPSIHWLISCVFVCAEPSPRPLGKELLIGFTPSKCSQPTATRKTVPLPPTTHQPVLTTHPPHTHTHHTPTCAHQCDLPLPVSCRVVC